MAKYETVECYKTDKEKIKEVCEKNEIGETEIMWMLLEFLDDVKEFYKLK